MSALKDLVQGKGVHVAPLAAVEGLTAELAGRRVPGFAHTVWQLVGHLNYWMDYGLKWIEGGTASWPTHADQTWPAADGPVDDLAWRHELALFRTNLDQLATLADARASTLSRFVHKESGKTVETILLELATHNSYHCGQIVQLRQALGAWPPPKGGLVW